MYVIDSLQLLLCANQETHVKLNVNNRTYLFNRLSRVRRVIFLFYLNKTPKECCYLRIFCYFCNVVGIMPSALHILMKVFSLLSLTRNLENFTTKRITTALISCIVMWLCPSWHTPHTIQVWGLVIVYF